MADMALTRFPAQRLVRLGMSLAAIAYLFFLADSTLHVAHAEGPSEGPAVIKGAFQSEPVTPGAFDGDVRDLPKAKAWKPGDPIREIPRRTRPPQGPEPPQPAQPYRDPLLELQESAPEGIADRDFTTPDLNFEGTSFTGVVPPDTVGDVGPNHYIQMVNHFAGSVFAIHDKAGNLLAGTTVLSSLWTLGGACSSGFGDPIVLYDRLANRWLMRIGRRGIAEDGEGK